MILAGPCTLRGEGTGQFFGVFLRRVDVVATSSSNVDLTLNRETSLPLYGGTLRTEPSLRQVGFLNLVNAKEFPECEVPFARGNRNE
jgi:hypothetical protein